MATDILEKMGAFTPYQYDIRSFRVHVRGRLDSVLMTPNGGMCEIVIGGALINIYGATPNGLLIGAEYIVYVDRNSVSFEMVQK